MDTKTVWLLAFLVKLHRGDTVKDAADVADKAEGAFLERFDEVDDDEDGV